MYFRPTIICFIFVLTIKKHVFALILCSSLTLGLNASVLLSAWVVKKKTLFWNLSLARIHDIWLNVQDLTVFENLVLTVVDSFI